LKILVSHLKRNDIIVMQKDLLDLHNESWGNVQKCSEAFIIGPNGKPIPLK